MLGTSGKQGQLATKSVSSTKQRRSTLSYEPLSCHASRTTIGLQCLLFISSSTSFLASRSASRFVC